MNSFTTSRVARPPQRPCARPKPKQWPNVVCQAIGLDTGSAAAELFRPRVPRWPETRTKKRKTAQPVPASQTIRAMARKIPGRRKRTLHFLVERSRFRKVRGLNRTSVKRNGRGTKRLRPLIFVCSKQAACERTFHRAHLRYRDGYLYLSWREGKRVRSYYLGRASRNYLKH